MTVSRFDDVIGAIDTLIDEEIELTPVRFAAPTLTDREIEDFITAQLAAGEDGGATAANPVAVPPVPVTPVRRARQYTATRPTARRPRSTARVEPRPNRYASVCVDCERLVPAGEGVLTRGRGKWLVRPGSGWVACL